MKTVKPKSEFHWPILGHNQIIEYLQFAISSNQLAHAYIFSGPNNLGKYLTAVTLAATLLCQGTDRSKPCQACGGCQQLEKNTHPDIEIIRRDPEKKNIGIEQIRQLQHKLSLRSFLTKYKIAIIDEAETLTEEAANALLKTLEEPTPQTMIIVITESSSLLLDTINSRCQKIQFNYLSFSLIENWLIDNGATKTKASEITHFSQGRPGLALLALANPTLLEIRYNRITQLISMINSPITERLITISTLTAKDPENKKYYYDLIQDWLTLFRDIILSKNDVNLLINFKFKNSILALGKHYQIEKVFNIVKSLQQAQAYLTQTINPRLVLENTSLLF